MSTPFATPEPPLSSPAWVRLYVTLGFLAMFASWVLSAFNQVGLLWMAGVVGGAGLLVLAVARPRIQPRRVPKMLVVTLLVAAVMVPVQFASVGTLTLMSLWWVGAILATVAATLLSFEELLGALIWASALSILAGLIARLSALLSGSLSTSPVGSEALGNVALWAFIIAAVRLATLSTRRVAPSIALALAALAFMLNWSVGSMFSIVSVVIALGFAQWMRARPATARRPVYALGVPVALLGLGLLAWLTAPMFGAWWPLADWFGWPGLIALVLLVCSAWWRSWFLAVDQPQLSATESLPYATGALLSLLLVVAISTQTFFVGGLASAAGFTLLAVVALVTKRIPHTNEQLP